MGQPGQKIRRCRRHQKRGGSPTQLDVCHTVTDPVIPQRLPDGVTRQCLKGHRTDKPASGLRQNDIDLGPGLG